MRPLHLIILVGVFLLQSTATGKPKAHAITFRYRPQPGWYFEQAVTWEHSLEKKGQKPLRVKGSVVMRRCVQAIWEERIARETIEFVKVRMTGVRKDTWSSLDKKTVVVDLGKPGAERFRFDPGEALPETVANIVILLRGLWMYAEHLDPPGPVKVKARWPVSDEAVVKTLGITVPEDASGFGTRGSGVTLLKTVKKQGARLVSVRGLVSAFYRKGRLVWGPGAGVELTMPGDGASPRGDLRVEYLLGPYEQAPELGTGKLRKLWTESRKFTVKTKPLKPRKPDPD